VSEKLQFGEGWLTKSAQDLCKIAIVFGGFDAGELVLAITKVQGNRDAKASIPTVEKALQMVYEAHETPEEKAARAAAYAALKAKLNG
jgi:hypothetical protein